jgi:hypothetical protein
MIKRFLYYLRKVFGIQHGFNYLYKQNTEILDKLNEIEWAFIYWDSIKGRKYLQENSLNIGRWAGNYSFFYVLNRIMHDMKPRKIFEIGLGESSKFISQCAQNIKEVQEHLIIEHDMSWILFQSDNFRDFCKTKIFQHDLTSSSYQDYSVLKYRDIEKYFDMEFDFYLIDGPFGTNNFSRYQIIEFVNRFQVNKSFVIMMDDTHRFGEKQTLDMVKKILEEKNIRIFHQDYSGVKKLSVLVSQDLKFLTSL